MTSKKIKIKRALEITIDESDNYLTEQKIFDRLTELTNGALQKHS